MAKPTIVQLSDTGARRIELVKYVPDKIIYGDEDVPGGNCADLLDYMLDPDSDEFNPEGYSSEESEFADTWMGLYEKSKTDVNYNVGLFALGKNDKPVDLSLESKITDYINDTPSSILKTKTIEDGDNVEKYNSIDLILEDMSTGGYSG